MWEVILMVGSVLWNFSHFSCKEETTIVENDCRRVVRQAGLCLVLS